MRVAEGHRCCCQGCGFNSGSGPLCVECVCSVGTCVCVWERWNEFWNEWNGWLPVGSPSENTLSSHPPRPVSCLVHRRVWGNPQSRAADLEALLLWCYSPRSHPQWPRFRAGSSESAETSLNLCNPKWRWDRRAGSGAQICVLHQEDFHIWKDLQMCWNICIFAGVWCSGLCCSRSSETGLSSASAALFGAVDPL